MTTTHPNAMSDIEVHGHERSAEGEVQPTIELVTQEGKNKQLGVWLFIAAESVLFASFLQFIWRFAIRFRMDLSQRTSLNFRLFL